MDEADFAFLIFFPIFAFFMLLLIIFAAAESSEQQPPRLQVVCDNLDGKVVENVCIKNGAVVYKD